ncbi:hypothetical protein F5Y18DRAFT_400683 [Xylariaceae sp. FL1019]|nr:hypothetical protein F5Y18DRAFT_400683 [Xylariaceae sp. FL1019]
MSKPQIPSSIPELTPSYFQVSKSWFDNNAYWISSRSQHPSSSPASYLCTGRRVGKPSDFSNACVQRRSTDSCAKRGTNFGPGARGSKMPNYQRTPTHSSFVNTSKEIRQPHPPGLGTKSHPIKIDDDSKEKREIYDSLTLRGKLFTYNMDANPWSASDIGPITDSSSVIALPEELAVSSAVRAIIASVAAATVFLRCFASSTDHGLRLKSDQSLWGELAETFNATSCSYTIKDLDMAKVVAATLCSAPYQRCVELQLFDGDDVLLPLIPHCRRFFYHSAPCTSDAPGSLDEAPKANATGMRMSMTNSPKTLEQREALMEILKNCELEKTSELRRSGMIQGIPGRSNRSPQNQTRVDSYDATHTYSIVARQTVPTYYDSVPDSEHSHKRPRRKRPRRKRPRHSEGRVFTMQPNTGTRTYKRTQSWDTQLHTRPSSKQHTYSRPIEAHPTQMVNPKKGARGMVEKSLGEQVRD